MVTKWGLSEKLGPLMYAEEEGEVFLGRSAGSQATNVSGETAKAIDEEVRSIIDGCYGTAKRLLEENRDKLDMMADALMKYETIDADQIDDIMSGRTRASRVTGRVVPVRRPPRSRRSVRKPRSAVRLASTKAGE